MAEHTLPPNLQSYQTAIRPNDPINTDTMLTFTEVLLVIFDEISINSDSKSNLMKFLVTSGQTNLRDAYGHYRKVRRRMASAVATTNYIQFIREAEGNRRYIGIDLVGTKNIYDYPLNYEGAYAQAVYLLEHGYEPKPTYEESQRISQYNRHFMTPNDCEEALRTFVRHPTEGDTAEAYAAGDLQRELNLRGFYGNTYNVVNIGRAMRALGFESRKIRGYSKYLVVLVDAVRQQRERQEDAVCG
jgi:predicted P-loop ATPase